MTKEQLDNLERLSSLLDKGLITREEFDAQKAKILGQALPAEALPAVPNAVPKSAQAPEPPKATRYWTLGRIILAMIGVPGAFLIGVVFYARTDGDLSKNPIAKFDVRDVVVDDSCTRLLDYCVRVSCKVRNVGLVNGSAKVEMQLLAEGQPPSAHSTSVTIAKGQETVITHDFGDARLKDSHKGRCIVR